MKSMIMRFLENVSHICFYRFPRGLPLLFATIVTLSPQTVLSQESKLEEIVVTATRVERSLQEVPVSVTALTNEELRRLGATDVRDLEQAVPSLVITGSGHNTFFPLAIRGIFTESRVNGFELAYGVYIDGVYMGRPMATNMDLVDVERVEVLRGPQGTLFGRNTIAGAINITTRKADLEEPTFYIEQTVGNYDLFETRAAASYPLIPGTLAVKASTIRVVEDGYVTNIFGGQNQDLNNDDRLSGRFELRYTPTDKLEINVTADFLTEDRRVNFVEVYGPRGERLAPGRRTVNHNTLEESDRDLWGLSANVNYQFDTGHELTSITAFRSGESFFINDNDATPVNQTTAPFLDQMAQFTQELRLASPVDNRLRYVLGSFYMFQDTVTKHDFFMGPRMGDPTVENDFLVGVPGFPTGFSDLDRSKHHIETESYAFFGNVEYDLMEKLSLILGLRFTHESKDLEGQESGSIINAPVPKFTDSLTDEDLSPTAGLSYAFTDKINTYFRWSRGFRSGGYNNDLFIPGSDIEFGSEQVDAYEIGLKSQFWNDRIRLNIAAFYTDYKDLQQPSFDDTAQVPFITITNAGSAEVKGVEVDYTALLTPSLTLNGGFSYTEAKFDEFRNVLVIGDDFSGFRLPKVPEWTANARLQYKTPFPVFDDSEFIAQIHWSYRGDFFSETRNDPRELVTGRSLVNARVGVTIGEKWEFFFWGKNVLDENYLNEKRVVDAFGQTWVNWGKPRTYGITASYRY